MGGAAAQSNELLIDGAPDTTGNLRVAYNPPVDAVDEIRVHTFEADAAYGVGDSDEEFTGRCGAILSNGKRCPNAALPGSRFCGVPAHQALEGQEPAPVADGDGAPAPEATAEEEGDTAVEQEVAAAPSGEEEGEATAS